MSATVTMVGYLPILGNLMGQIGGGLEGGWWWWGLLDGRRQLNGRTIVNTKRDCDLIYRPIDVMLCAAVVILSLSLRVNQDAPGLSMIDGAHSCPFWKNDRKA